MILQLHLPQGRPVSTNWESKPQNEAILVCTKTTPYFIFLCFSCGLFLMSDVNVADAVVEFSDLVLLGILLPFLPRLLLRRFALPGLSEALGGFGGEVG